METHCCINASYNDWDPRCHRWPCNSDQKDCDLVGLMAFVLADSVHIVWLCDLAAIAYMYTAWSGVFLSFIYIGHLMEVIMFGFKGVFIVLREELGGRCTTT